MIELLKQKSIIILAIMIISVCFMTGLENKKTAEIGTQNGQNETVLYK